MKIPDLMRVRTEPRIEPVFSNENWSHFGLSVSIHPHLTACLLDRFKLKRLTAIQEQAIPPLIQSKNALIRAQTGSGKTLAYAVPLLNQLMSLEPPVSRTDGPLALIILPTRELATQTFEVLQILTKSCVRIVPGCLIGGMKRKAQKASLRKGVNIVIGTPQRLLDHMLRTSSLVLKNLRWLVIDEADRLLEMGFEHNVRRILQHVINARQTNPEVNQPTLQTVLLSATLTPGVENLAGLALEDPVRCVVREPKNIRGNGLEDGSDEQQEFNSDLFSMPAGLKHFLLVVPWKLRLVSLAAFLLLKCRYHKHGGKLIVFMATQDCVDFHYQLFTATLCPDDEELMVPTYVSNLSLFRLHGSMEHSEREKVFRDFSVSRSGILLTTDVASRGLDLASVAWVVLYHVTGGPVDYVHRVGRTARAGGRGKAVLFLDQSELGYTDLLQARAGIEFENLSLPELMQTALFHMCHTKRRGASKPASCATVEESTSRFSHLFMSAVCDDSTLLALAESAYTSFLRSYASFSGELRQFFTFKRLHLGHVAHAFCLRAAPKDVAAKVAGRLSHKRKDNEEAKVASSRKRKLALDIDEVVQNERHVDGVRPESAKRKTVCKPSDMARRNMLAEFGL
ncbi:unnamed protein product [Calicophoron daubneyi]